MSTIVSKAGLVGTTGSLGFPIAGDNTEQVIAAVSGKNARKNPILISWGISIQSILASYTVLSSFDTYRISLRYGTYTDYNNFATWEKFDTREPDPPNGLLIPGSTWTGLSFTTTLESYIIMPWVDGSLTRIYPPGRRPVIQRTTSGDAYILAITLTRINTTGYAPYDDRALPWMTVLT